MCECEEGQRCRRSLLRVLCGGSFGAKAGRTCLTGLTGSKRSAGSNQVCAPQPCALHTVDVPLCDWPCSRLVKTGTSSSAHRANATSRRLHIAYHTRCSQLMRWGRRKGGCPRAANSPDQPREVRMRHPCTYALTSQTRPAHEISIAVGLAVEAPGTHFPVRLPNLHQIDRVGGACSVRLSPAHLLGRCHAANGSLGQTRSGSSRRFGGGELCLLAA